MHCRKSPPANADRRSSECTLEQDGEALRRAVRSIRLNAALDDGWLIVILEFKRHALRNPHSVAPLRENYNQMWTNSMRF
jgi:hypothetical protein